MKKLRKATLLLLVCSMLMEAISVCAGGQSFTFRFTSKDQKKQTTSYAKEDNEQNAYVTLQELAESTFITGDVLGCRVRRASNASAMTDYTLLREINRYVLPYTSTGYAGVSYYLVGQIDSTGMYDNLVAEGVWLP